MARTAPVGKVLEPRGAGRQMGMPSLEFPEFLPPILPLNSMLCTLIRFEDVILKFVQQMPSGNIFAGLVSSIRTI